MGRRIGAGLVAALAAMWSAGTAQAVSPDVVISQVYGGGGNSGATYTHDYVLLHNRGTAAVDVTGWSVQYASAAGTSWQVTALSGTIAAGDSYLVQEGQGAGGTTPLPTPDASGTIAMSATSGKVALVTTATALACGADCDRAAGVRDFVGYGAANDFETAAAPALSNTTAAIRTGTADTDDNAADFTAGPPAPGGGDGPPPTPDEVRIHDIQGFGHLSPLVGDLVRTTGIVTAKNAAQFYMQDPVVDPDPLTSEGLLVFGSSAAAAVAVGDAVTVTGTVTEFRPGGASSPNLSVTELTSPTVEVTSSSTTLPAAVDIGTPPSVIAKPGNLEAQPLEPQNYAIDFFEVLEGMRVQVDDAVASGPTNAFGEVSVLPDGGASASLRTPRGGIVVRLADFNGERVILDDTLAPTPVLDVGDTLPGATLGVVDYSFGNYKVNVTSLPAAVDGGLQRETTRAAGRGELSFATFNVENLDPADPPAKFAALARLIVEHLRSPDLLSLEEVQDDNGPTNDSTVSAGQTYNTLVAAIQAAGGPTYAFRQVDPVDDQDGGEPGGNIRVGFLFRSDRGLSFVDRPGGSATTPVAVQPGPQLSISPGRIDPANPAFANSRKPLAGEFEFGGEKLFVVANHWNSKGGDDPLYGRFQPPTPSSQVQREQQAQVVHDFVEDLLAEDPDAHVVVLGDLNDFPFSAPLDLLTEGGVLENLILRLPEHERYTYVFDGNSQALDHILASPAAAERIDFVDVVHVNAEFADQVSDHDPMVAIGDFSEPIAACDAALGAVGCWAFDEAGGPTAVDASGNHNDGTYVKGPGLGVPGVVGTAVSMDGTNDHVRVPDDPTLDVGDSFTLEGWVKRDTDARTHQLFNKGGRGFQLVVMSRFDGNRVSLRKVGSSTIVRSAGGVPADGRFHHVVATKDGPNSARLYIDGVQQALQQVSPAVVIQDTASPLYFSSPPSGDPVAGDLDEYAVYDRALTAAEVAARYDRGAEPTAAARMATTTAAPSG